MSGTTTLSASDFTEIPYNWKVPGEYMEIKPGTNQNAVLPFPARGLVMGQMYATGSATAGTRYPIYSADQANTLFGAGSQIAMMCAEWLLVNPYTAFDAMGIADAALSTKAAGTVTIAGTATASSTLPVYVGGVRVPVGVAVGDTAAEVAANLYATLQLQGQPGYPWLPSITPAYTAGDADVTLNCGHGGTLGNAIDIRLCAETGETVPAGLTVTITPMTGGATDPTAAIAAGLASITSTWYTDVAFAWTDEADLSALMNWMAPRYGAMVKLDVQGYVSFSGTYGTILACEPNSQFLCDLPQRNPLTPGWIMAAAEAAACCYQTANQPSLQLRSVPLPGIRAPADADLFDEDERQALLLAGHSTFTVDATGTVYLNRMVTTRRTLPNGTPTTSYFDLSSTKTPTRVRYDWENYCAQMWPRNQLCDDGTIAAEYNPNAVTPKLLTASWASRSSIYEQNGWIQNSAATAAASSFAIDPNDSNRVNGNQKIDIMGNLIVLAGILTFYAND